MPRQKQPPRLSKRAARPEKGQKACWIIRDEGKEYSTGCGLADIAGAEAALQEYLNRKGFEAEARAQSTIGQTALDKVMVVDVINYYLDRKEPSEALVKAKKQLSLTKDERKAVRAYNELLLRSERLIEWWGDKSLIEINEETCSAYVTWRTSKLNRRATKGEAGKGKRISTGTARRDLEDLRAAVNRYHARYTLPAVPVVSLPEKSKRRERWLDRHEMARALWAVLGWKWHLTAQQVGKIGFEWNPLKSRFESANLSRTQKGRFKQVRTRRRHVGRFLLIGYYTATRHTAMLDAQWVPSSELPYVDVNAGLFYRKGSDVSETKKRQPPVRIPSRLLAHMRRWRRQDMARGITSVIHNNGNRLMTKLRTAWEGMIDDAGLDASVVRHTLRHTAVTTLMQGGMSTTDAAAFAGMSEQVVIDTYFHHHPDYQSGADDAFEKARQRSKKVRSGRAA